MSSREIADLLECRHDNVKRTIERLADRGIIVQPPLEDERGFDSLGRPRTEAVYHVGKRDSYVIVAQLSPEFTARLVDRWQELEEAQAGPKLPNFNNPAEAARAWALAYEQADNERASTKLVHGTPSSIPAVCECGPTVVADGWVIRSVCPDHLQLNTVDLCTGCIR